MGSLYLLNWILIELCILFAGDYKTNIGSNAIGSAMNKIQIKASRDDLSAVYACRAFSQALNESLWIRVEIEVNGEFIFLFILFF